MHAKSPSRALFTFLFRYSQCAISILSPLFFPFCLLPRSFQSFHWIRSWLKGYNQERNADCTLSLPVSYTNANTVIEDDWGSIRCNCFLGKELSCFCFAWLFVMSTTTLDYSCAACATYMNIDLNRKRKQKLSFTQRNLTRNTCCHNLFTPFSFPPISPHA